MAQMNLALAGAGPATMSSLEIAKLTGKRPADVMRDIRTMLEQLDIGERNFASSYHSPQGKELPCFALPKRETIILVTGYSIPMRAAVVDRWAELEALAAGNTPKVPQTLAQALRLAADQAERIEDLETENAALRVETAPRARHAVPIGQAPAERSSAPAVTFQKTGIAFRNGP